MRKLRNAAKKGRARIVPWPQIFNSWKCCALPGLHFCNAPAFWSVLVGACLPQTLLETSTANWNLSGQGPSILLRKTVLSLKSSTGAFIVPLRSTNANLLYYLFSINPIIEKINPTIPIPITSSPIPDEQREIMIAKSSIAIPKPIFFIETSPSQNSYLLN